MTQELSLSDRLIKYLKNFPNQFVCGGELQKLAARAGYESSNAARRLRELTAEGILDVDHRKGENGVKVSWYAYKPQKKVVVEYVKVTTTEGDVVKPIQKTIFD